MSGEDQVVAKGPTSLGKKKSSRGGGGCLEKMRGKGEGTAP